MAPIFNYTNVAISIIYMVELFKYDYFYDIAFYLFKFVVLLFAQVCSHFVFKCVISQTTS